MPKRPVCPACDRPIKTCLCDVMVKLSCHYQLLILQDPTEARHALSSAPLLAKSIEGARLIVGEIFQPEVIAGDNWRNDALLIYPQGNTLSTTAAVARRSKTLILLDGTWRKVARLLHLNPWLGELPCFAIEPDQPSRYTIRKSPKADGLSTIEAAAAALNELQQVSTFTGILAAFDKMIALQISAMGEEVFRENYPGS